MPYIQQKDREKFKEILEIINKIPIESEGNLNYLITNLCLKFIRENKISYSRLNSVIGVLNCVELEFYRKVILNYEEQKIIQNGDIF